MAKRKELIANCGRHEGSFYAIFFEASICMVYVVCKSVNGGQILLLALGIILWVLCPVSQRYA